MLTPREIEELNKVFRTHDEAMKVLSSRVEGIEEAVKELTKLVKEQQPKRTTRSKTDE